jgi:ANTAR domain/GAF domain
MANSEEAAHGSTPPVDISRYDLGEVAAAMQSLSDQVADGASMQEPLQRLVLVAVERVPGARWASVTMLRGDHFITAAVVGEPAVRADALQYEIGSGPCVEAVLQNSLFITGTVGTDHRWLEWGQRVTAEVGVNSVLAQRLHLQDQDGVVAGLNLYSDAENAFDEAAVGMALILATHGGMVLSQQLAHSRAGNLSKALQSNRDIGVAMGILMQNHHFTQTEAFDGLRVASQNSNRKLADIAADVAETGSLTIDQHRG